MEKSEPKLVLVVDDEPDVRMYIEVALEDAGFAVVTAANGHEAYKRVKERVPDFITLDLVMPGQSGALFYLKLCKNKNWCEIPVMIVSAHAQDELGQEDFRQLMKGQDAPRPAHFMEKPVRPAELVRVVCETLGVTGRVDEAVHGARDEVLERLRSADLETLQRVRSVLDEEEG
jgi:CheY-like chemotaxis protein